MTNDTRSWGHLDDHSFLKLIQEGCSYGLMFLVTSMFLLFIDTCHLLSDSSTTSILFLFSQRQLSDHLINESWLISLATCCFHQTSTPHLLLYQLLMSICTSTLKTTDSQGEKKPVWGRKCFMAINLLKIRTREKNAILFRCFALFFLRDQVWAIYLHVAQRI